MAAPASGVLRVLPLMLLLTGLACSGEAPCADCDVLRIAATGEPTTLVPPLVNETVGRDVTDRIYERLAILAPGGSPTNPDDFRPGLAVRWTALDSSGWRFVLRPGATWHDGQPVTAADVVFSFRAYADTALGSPAPALVGRVSAEAEGDSAVLVRFLRPTPETLYEATSSVRVLPEHVWGAVPAAEWSADTGLSRIIGSGPFRLGEWTRSQALTLHRVDPAPGAVNRMVWFFAGDQDAAANLLLAGQADLIETVTSPSALALVERDTNLVRVPYPSAVYGFLGFRHRTANGAADPVLGDRTVRRALVAAIDRTALVRAVLGPETAVPAGPVSRASWLWNDNAASIAYDTTLANRWLDSIGYRRGGDGIRQRGGRRLAVDILVPGTSRVRRDLAQGIEAMWRSVGVAATITAVDFPVFQERLSQGRFETMVGAWLDEPSPGHLIDQWGRAGWGGLNYGRYTGAFDSLAELARTAADAARARQLWHQAFDSLNADAAAVFLYTPTNVAVRGPRAAAFPIDPFSWLEAAAPAAP